MLQAMQEAASTQPSPSFSDFAGLLATLATPPPDTTEDAARWNSSDLGEDVATLSYEQALRARARYRSAYRSNGSAMPPDGMDATAGIESVAAGAAPAMLAAVALDRDLRSASVTIRLSKAESAKLHQRAGESGLTVSAYLRACALEAETLRAQVKQALAELKAGNEGTRERGSKETGWRRFFGWIRRLTQRGQ